MRIKERVCPGKIVSFYSLNIMLSQAGILFLPSDVNPTMPALILKGHQGAVKCLDYES